MKKKLFNCCTRLYLKEILCFFFLVLSWCTRASSQDSVQQEPVYDSLLTVSVTAFQLQARWKEVPAAVAVLSGSQLQMVNSASLVPGLNLVPGVRMEERSPGSYRLSIRGSLLRSPFGVRNVKLYWNDIPFTDAGGNTYLQLVEVSQVRSAEIIKGPASSLYGANTGGAMILHTGGENLSKTNAVYLSLMAGSYGLLHQQAGWKHEGKYFKTQLQQTHTNLDGYRQQSRLRKDALKWDGNWKINEKQELFFLTNYTDLYYQTPGGITEQQMLADPKLARQATVTLPGAVEQNTAVFNKTFFNGAALRSAIGSHWQNNTSVVFSHTDFANPFITNYEERKEWNYGGRTSFRYQQHKEHYQLQWLTGGEWQQNHSFIDNYENEKGHRGDMIFNDEVYATSHFLFTQLHINFYKWKAQAGMSLNQQAYRYQRKTDPANNGFQSVKTGYELAPRFSLLYEFSRDVSFYGIVSKGFSAPTLAEIRPSDGQFYPQLRAEHGMNYEAGIKGAVWNNRLVFDAAFYYFRLREAITRQQTLAGEEYFINSGSTMQKGLEAWAKAILVKNERYFISSLTISNSLSYQPFRFEEYKAGTADYSGNRLTGVPRWINVSTASVKTKTGLFSDVIYNHTGSLPLNDANDTYANAYHLLHAKLGYGTMFKKINYSLFVGGDNLLNQTYSLGHDLNAAGKRYYNPASRRNYYAGVRVEL